MSDSEIPLDITGHESTGGPNQPDRPTPYPDDDDPEDPDGQTDESVEPVEVLVQLADDGEIDPWDIDIVAVTDKFLRRIDEVDLRTSGRALFYASVLLRMKSDVLFQPADPEPDEPAPWETAMEGDAATENVDPVTTLEAEMDRRLDRRRARGIPQTLDQLVRDLREAERDSWWKDHREYDTSDSPSGYNRGTQELDYRTADDLRLDDEPTESDVTGTAHAENIDEIIRAVQTALETRFERGRDEVLFAEIGAVAGSRIQTYLGLLFLSHRNEVRLDQDELFGDLWIGEPVGDAAETISP